MAYIAYESGFLIGAAFNKTQGTDFITTYRDASPVANLIDQVLPTSGLFSSPDTYQAINEIINENRIEKIDSFINDESNNNGLKCK